MTRDTCICQHVHVRTFLPYCTSIKQSECQTMKWLTTRPGHMYLSTLSCAYFSPLLYNHLTVRMPDYEMTTCTRDTTCICQHVHVRTFLPYCTTIKQSECQTMKWLPGTHVFVNTCMCVLFSLLVQPFNCVSHNFTSYLLCNSLDTSTQLRTRWISNKDHYVSKTSAPPCLWNRLRWILNESRTMNQSRRSRRRYDSLIRYKSTRLCMWATLLKKNWTTRGTTYAMFPDWEERNSKLLSFSIPVTTGETVTNIVLVAWRNGSGKALLIDDIIGRLHDWPFSTNRTDRSISYKTTPKQSPRHTSPHATTAWWQHTTLQSWMNSSPPVKICLHTMARK